MRHQLATLPYERYGIIRYQLNWIAYDKLYLEELNNAQLAVDIELAEEMKRIWIKSTKV
jgi:hypothetical protein